MQLNLNNAWRFNHPDFDIPEVVSGLSVSQNGKISMISGQGSIRQGILLLLSTMPGERVMRPEYGCNLHQLAFLPNDATTHGLAIHHVRTALERWEQRIDILKIDANSNPSDPTVMDIILEYKVRGLQDQEQLSMIYQLMGDTG